MKVKDEKNSYTKQKIIDPSGKKDKEVKDSKGRGTDNEKFFFDLSQLSLSNKNFGFKDHKKDLKSFRDNILKSMSNTYRGLTWKEVKAKKHCHPCKMNKDKEKLTKEYNEDGYDIFQINIPSKNNSHRLIGYIQDSVLYIFFNDPTHKWSSYPQSSK